MHPWQDPAASPSWVAGSADCGSPNSPRTSGVIVSSAHLLKVKNAERLTSLWLEHFSWEDHAAQLGLGFPSDGMIAVLALQSKQSKICFSVWQAVMMPKAEER